MLPAAAGVIYRLIRPLLFRLDAEVAHELTLRQMLLLQRLPGALAAVSSVCRADQPRLSRTVWGLRFRNPLGIAAGFDKNAQAIPFLEALGFGFIEVGTVTPQPQPGNPRPRIFRYPPERALVNRLGFNNVGAATVAERLRKPRKVPVFVNIGKNRDVPLEQAERDYLDCYRLVAPHADGVVVNVSSPNTPGLRELQSPEHLERILAALREVRTGPILVKIAPDLTSAQLREIAKVCTRRADGMVATNTTIERPGGIGDEEPGGLSGAPLFARSTEVLRELRSMVGPNYPLVGVGGIFTAAEARQKLEAGADLVQAYTGFVYQGPGFVKSVLRGLTG